MPKINLVKAIVRYRSSVNRTQSFLYGTGTKENQSRYLLMQKAIDDFFPENIGKWECIGGRIKNGETSEKAIKREIEEETGLEMGRNARIVKQFPTLKSDKSICDVYLIDVASMNVKLSSEHSDFKWVRAEEVKKMDLVRYANLLLEFFNNPEKYF